MRTGALRHLAALAAIALAACAAPRAEAPPAAEPVPEPAPPPAERSVLTIGVILPQTGPAYLQPYAEAVLEGVRVAVAEHEAAGGHRVNLLIRDDGGRTASAAEAVRELAAAGAAGIVGPLTDQHLAMAAQARPDNGLVIVGPTATRPSSLPNVYAFNVEDTAAAAALGRFAAGEPGRGGVLHPKTARGTAEARAFAAAHAAAGGAAPLLVAFDSGTTNFASDVRRLRDARVRQLFIPGNPREIRQILPQLGYYGLGDVQILGGEVWAAEDLRRAVPPEQLEGAIVATVLPRESSEVGWGAFEEAYGRLYRRTIASPIPALGYDAAKVILDAAPRGRVSAGDVRSGVDDTGTIRGATGVFQLTEGAARRRPFLMRIRAGELVPVSTGGS